LGVISGISDPGYNFRVNSRVDRIFLQRGAIFSEGMGNDNNL